MNKPTRFKFEPDPPVAGEDLVIVYKGPAKRIEVSFGDGKSTHVTPDGNGRVVVSAPGWADEVMVSDGTGFEHGGYDHRNVIQMQQ